MALAACLLAAAAALLAGWIRPGHGSAEPVHLRGQVTWAPGSRPAPEFRLHDQAGRPVSLASEHGRVLLLTFLDSRCTTLCPVTGHQLAQVQRALPAHGWEILAVSIDPAGDTPASARAAVRRFGWHGHWRWLFGRPRALASVWRRYGIDVEPTAGDVQHSAAVYVIDGAGDERAGFLIPLRPTEVAHDVRALAS